MQKSLEHSLRSVGATEELKDVLDEIKNNLHLLHPVLNKLNQPRRITLVENSNGNLPHQ